MNTPIERFNQFSLFEFPGLFASMSPPRPEALRGLFQGSFVGPGWLRRLAGPLLVITGLGGWWGKEFDAQGNATNLVYRKGRYEHIFPMLLVEQPSFFDHKPSLALRYAPDNPLPWPWILDELRCIQPGLLLGMTMVRYGPFRRLALPFVLQSRESVDGR